MESMEVFEKIEALEASALENITEVVPLERIEDSIYDLPNNLEEPQFEMRSCSCMTGCGNNFSYGDCVCMQACGENYGK